MRCHVVRPAAATCRALSTSTGHILYISARVLGFFLGLFWFFGGFWDFAWLFLGFCDFFLLYFCLLSRVKQNVSKIQMNEKKHKTLRLRQVSHMQ